MVRGLLFLFLASCSAAAIQDPQARNDSGVTPVQDFEARPLRLLDATGAPLPAGTRVELRTEWYLLDRAADERYVVGLNDELFDVQVVGPDGLLTWARSRSGPPHYRGFLHARLVGPSKPRLRAFVPWPVETKSDSPIELSLEPERILCSGRVVDEQGKRVALDSLAVEIRDARAQPLVDAMRLLDAKLEPSESGYVIRGWPQSGPWEISAQYFHDGPESLPHALDFGKPDVDMILPVTGHVQPRAKLPAPCPSGALEAVYTHVESGEVQRRTVLDRTTNHRLRAGAQRMRIELAGEPLLDLGEVQVPANGQLDVDLPLPATLRVLRVSLFDSEGKSIPAAHARIRGGDEKFQFNNDANLGAILVMTARESVELTIESDGFETVELSGVDGDRRVELRRSKR